MTRKRTQPRPSGLRDRIIELRRVVAGEILSHDKNWRLHPPVQLAALEGILGEVGIADALLGFPADGLGVVTADCPLMVFDGHARKDRDPSQVWPVLVMDLTRAEADKMLAVLDPTAAMAEPDEAARQALWDSLVLESLELREMLERQSGVTAGDAKEAEGTDNNTVLLDQSVQLKPKREYVMLVCDSEQDHEYLRELLGLKMVRRGGYKAGSPFDATSLERVVMVNRLRRVVDADRSAE